jgi:hypothetical protein
MDTMHVLCGGSRLFSFLDGFFVLNRRVFVTVHHEGLR